MKTTLSIILVASALAVGLVHGPTVCGAAPRPNIVHILTDDLGWMDPVCYYRAVRGRESLYETPSMDRLAANGMRFMQAYSPAPTCSPSRAAYMSGQYGPHNGVLHVMGGRLARPYHAVHAYGEPFYPARLPLDTQTIADVLKEAGYMTAHVQKWHCGGRSNGYPGPVAYGFDFSWEGKSGNPYNDPTLWDPSDKKRANFNGIWTPLRPHRLSDFPSSRDSNDPYALDNDDRPFDSVTDLALRWMDKVKDQGKPFFLNFCPSFVHGPFSTRDRKRLEHYCKKMGVPFPDDPGLIAEGQPSRQANPYYAAMLDSLDWQVGKLLAFLETTDDPRNPGHKLIDNTYVMLSSDNGGLEMSPVANGKGKGQRERITDNTPLRGGKLEVYEGGLRIPFIVQGPGVEAGSANDTPINLIDMFPTFLAMAGQKPRSDLGLDGCNVLPLILGKDDKARFPDGRVRGAIFFHYPSPLPSSSVIRKGGWKLLLYHGVGMDPKRPEVQLYRLYNDDGSVCDLTESKNQVETHQEKADELLQELKAWLKKHDAALPYKNAHTPGRVLPGSLNAPGIVKRHSEGSRIEVYFETGPGKSRIVDARLVYTTNGSDLLRIHRGLEEWFEAPATLGDGIAAAIAPPGMTHGVFYLRDENGFQVNSEFIPPYDGPGGKQGIGAELLKDGYAWRPGLISLIDTARLAEMNAKKAGLETSALTTAVQMAEAVAKTPVNEDTYASAMRNLRHEIRGLDVPEARLPVLNLFATKEWSNRDRGRFSAPQPNASAALRVRKPNIVHILTDDLGWMDVACYYRAVHGKGAVYETPHMDRIAQNGMRFMQAYSPSATCAPSRAAYMSGQYTPHTGVLHVTGSLPPRPHNPTSLYIDGFYPMRLGLNTPTIGRVLQEAGYLTSHIKKWHFGGRDNGYPAPVDYGFDFSWVSDSKDYNDPELWDPGMKHKQQVWNGIWLPLNPRHRGFATSAPNDPFRTDPNDDDRPRDGVTELAVRWLNKAKDQDKPFFLNLCPSLVHGPISTRDRKRLEYYCKKMGVPFPTDPGRITEKEWDKQWGQVNPYYASMVDGVDWIVGKILTLLETTDDPRNPGHKLIDNTYLMVSADNGAAEGRFRPKERVADNSPLRAGKSSVYEGGIRVPFIVRGPGIEPGSVSETPINLIDLFPTFMDMADAEPTEELDIDGCNILPIMKGEDTKARFSDGRARDTLYFTLPVGGCSSSVIRKGGWKLVLNHAPEGNGQPPVELFKMYNEDGSVADLGESRNLVDAHPEKRDELLAELNAWLEKYETQLPYKNPKVDPTEKTLPGADNIPTVVKRVERGNKLEVHFETGEGKSRIVDAILVYTTNGSDLLREKPNYEEWFRTSATLGDGVATAIAPPGMTHGIFCLRDENGFLVRSRDVPPAHGTGGDPRWTIAKDPGNAYAWRPGLISLIETAQSAKRNAEQTGQDVAPLVEAIRGAEAVARRPVDEMTHAVAMRGLRHEIRILDVPEAKLSVLNLFVTPKWSSRAQAKPAVTVRGDNAPREGAMCAFDGDPKTKWLDFSPEGSWIQYAFSLPAAVTSYAITSASDGPSRDPKDWQLLGSLDGKTWTTLDTRSGEMWSKRTERRAFRIDNKTAFRFYRLNIAAVRDTRTANSVQIAEIEFDTKADDHETKRNSTATGPASSGQAIRIKAVCLSRRNSGLPFCFATWTSTRTGRLPSTNSRRSTRLISCSVIRTGTAC